MSIFQNGIFIWQWGRFGAGPRYAYELAYGLRRQGEKVFLSLSKQAEIVQSVPPQFVDWLMPTYTNLPDMIFRSLFLGAQLGKLERFLCTSRPEAALCAMPGIWDTFVAARLRKLGIPLITIVHDAQSHPGDFFGPVYRLQKRLIHQSAGIITLSDFVAKQLDDAGLLKNKVHTTIPHIPFLFPDLDLPPPHPPGYPERPTLRLLMVGRLQDYKGLELLAEALDHLPEKGVEIRVAGKGRSKSLKKLANHRKVEYRGGWCTERELVTHIDWADVIMAPYQEATQSGIVSLALDRCRPVIATPVGGLPEQVKHEKTGLITQDVSAIAIAEAILRFLNQPQLFLFCKMQTCKESRTEEDWAHIASRFRQIIVQSISNAGKNIFCSRDNGSYKKSTQ